MDTLTTPLPGSEGFDPEAYGNRVGRHRAKTVGEKVLTLASFGHPNMIPTARGIVNRETMGDPTAERDAEALYRLMHSSPEEAEEENANGYQDPDMTRIRRMELPQPLRPQQPQERFDHPTDVAPRAR